MIYAARIQDGKVVEILAVPSVAWCETAFGGSWLEVRKDGSIRGKYPAIGDAYDDSKDEFVPQEADE
jgi:hypothetical protein